MNLSFTKMHGLGNDFMVVDLVSQTLPREANGLPFSKEVISAWADRCTGIGFDQLLIVEVSEQADFRYRIFNADGGEVEQCGNGARCFARFVQEQGLTDKSVLTVETISGIIQLTTEGDSVSVNMGIPRREPSEIPFSGADIVAPTYVIVAGRGELANGYEISVVSMGNPHCVLLTEDVDTAPVTKLGRLLESHEQFPQRANVGFMQIISRNEIRLRVYERGVGETMACGTGACAAVVTGQHRGLLDHEVVVSLSLGQLHISHDVTDEGSPVIMKGPVSFVFNGVIEF